ncbi:hypothetical protein LJR230_001488 [Trinickia sp. LjRoot230]|uniref:hypothetical protein n=1 Tax=Trinickia sp. LjRoot230 TaxID=3342288 RepID=UPI003ED14883
MLDFTNIKSLGRLVIKARERGDPGFAIGEVLRYLDAIAPGTSLDTLYSEKDPALAARERRLRVREMSAAERIEH